MTMQSKKTVQEPKPMFAGIDVGAEELILIIRNNGTPYKPQKFANTPADRARLVKKLVNLPGILVCLEATGVYHFDLSVALHDAGVALMVVNPKSSHNFAKALMKNSKTDASRRQSPCARRIGPACRHRPHPSCCSSSTLWRSCGRTSG